jgi:hypothetical protein
MSGGMEALCLRLLDLARGQKAALEAGNLDEVLILVVKRQQVLRAIQKIDGSASGQAGPGNSFGADGEPASSAALIREVLSIDEEAGAIARAGMQDASIKLGKINTFKVVCQGVFDASPPRSTVPVP